MKPVTPNESAKLQADSVIVGNTYNKYHTSNPIARLLMSRFLREVSDLYRQANPVSVLEVGCGEGFLAQHLIQHADVRPKRFVASDISLEHIVPGLDPLINFQEASIYNLPFDDNEFDLVVCCEVLEHLDHPSAGLAEVARVANQAVLLSTPREPLWRILNILRGRYLKSLGNTPGHVQHFSRRGLIRLVQKQLRLGAKRNPLPWTVLLGEPRK